MACSLNPLNPESIKSNPINPEPQKDSIVTVDDLPLKDSIIVMQWNIGHFSRGKHPNSSISDIDYNNKVKEYRQLLNNVSADVIALCEYSVLFANTTMHPSCYADTLLFSDYTNRFIGNNGRIRNYSLNAIMSKRGLLLPATIEYKANQSATISHTSAIKATDYYYNKTAIELCGHEVTLINTHLAFDTNNPDVAINQIIELIDALSGEEYVIICGDFNTVASSYELFKEAGYSLANEGDIGTFPSSSRVSPLDNIITKGLIIHNIFVVKSPLSDHYPIVCTITSCD